jgi:hypothetical protein
MTKAKVESILGKPDEIISYPDCSWCKRDEEIWFYKGSLFQIVRRDRTIIFKDDVVIRTNERNWTDK